MAMALGSFPRRTLFQTTTTSLLLRTVTLLLQGSRAALPSSSPGVSICPVVVGNPFPFPFPFPFLPFPFPTPLLSLAGSDLYVLLIPSTFLVTPYVRRIRHRPDNFSLSHSLSSLTCSRYRSRFTLPNPIVRLVTSRSCIVNLHDTHLWFPVEFFDHLI